MLKNITSEFEYSGILNTDKVKDLVSGMKLREKDKQKLRLHHLSKKSQKNTAKNGYTKL